MKQYLQTIYEKGFYNHVDADVIIYCQDKQIVRAHSFVLYHCSNLYQMENAIKQSNIWDLSNYNIKDVKRIVSQMYHLDCELVSGFYNLDTVINKLVKFYDVVQYIMPTECFAKAIQKIFIRNNNIIYKLIEKQNFTNSDRNYDYMNLTILNILIIIQNNSNEYLVDMRNELYKKYNPQISNLIDIRELYTKSIIFSDSDLFANFGKETIPTNFQFIIFAKQLLPVIKIDKPGLSNEEYIKIITEKWCISLEKSIDCII